MNEFKNLVPVEKLEIKELSTSVVVENSNIKYFAIAGLLIGAIILSVYLVNLEYERRKIRNAKL